MVIYKQISVKKNAMRKGNTMNFLLIRGLTREQRHWGDFILKLQSAFPQAKINFLDLPGAGQNNNATAPTKISQYVEFLRNQFQILKMNVENKSWHYFGVSLAGMVGLEWASKYPKDFSSYIIMNTSAKDLSPARKRILPFSAYNLSKMLLLKDPTEKEKIIYKITSNQEQNDKTISDWTKYRREKPIQFKNIAFQAIAGMAFKSPKKINAPTLLLAGKGDKLCHYSCGVNIANKYNFKYNLNDFAGHDLSYDAPDWIIDNVKDFLDEVFT